MMIDNSALVYIPEYVDNWYSNTHLSYGDVILSKTAIPAASLVTLNECNVSQDTVAIKLKKNSTIKPAFLVVLLNTKYGLAAMERRFTGNVQMHLNLTECKEKLLIPIFHDNLQHKISSLFNEAEKFKKNSLSKYAEAEHLLLSNFGLDNFTTSNQNTSIKKFSTVETSGRLDAEYYQTKYDELKERILSHTESVMMVKDISIENNRGVQPDYIENGEIAVVNSKNILENGLDYDGFSTTSRVAWKLNPKAQIKQGDILIYTTGANIGRAAMYRPNTPALASNHVNILRVKHPHPQYIAFVINSMIGRLQTEQISTGSAQQELYPKDIEQFMIPLLSEDLQIKIESLLDKSFDLREQSKSLLKAATQAVEIAIEEGEDKAIGYLERILK